MKFVVYLLFLAAACVACGPAETTPVAAAPDRLIPALPTQAQPRLRTITLWVGAEEITAEMALAPLQIQTGMMFRTNVVENEGMIFVLPYTQRAAFWMKNCPTSLSAAYIARDGAIREIRHLEKMDTNTVVAASADIQFVLEMSEGWFDRHHIKTGMVVRSEFGSLEKTFLQRR